MGWEIPSGRRRGLPRYDCVFTASEIGGALLGISVTPDKHQRHAR